MHVCLYTCGHMCECICMYVWRPKVAVRKHLPSLLCLTYWAQSQSELTDMPASQAEQLVGCQFHSLYYEFWGFELWSSCLQNKHLTTKPCFQLLGVPPLERNYFQYLVSMTTLKSFQNQDRTLNCFYGLSEESTQFTQEFYICL